MFARTEPGVEVSGPNGEGGSRRPLFVVNNLYYDNLAVAVRLRLVPVGAIA
jgi:hypothetical protein